MSDRSPESDQLVPELVAITSVEPEIASLALERCGGDLNRAAIECLDHFHNLVAELERRKRYLKLGERSPSVFGRILEPVDDCEDFESTFLVNRLKPLPIPKDREEFESRFRLYDKSRELRSMTFSQKKHKGYVEARRLYTEAYRLIGFLETPYEKLSHLDLSPSEQLREVKKIVIVLRKIGECCFYLNRLAEGEHCCKRAVEVAEKFNLRSICWFAFAVLTNIFSQRSDFESADLALKTAQSLKSGSPTIYRTKVTLERAKRRGIESIDSGPMALKRAEPHADWYEGDEIVRARFCGVRELWERFQFGISLFSSRKFPWFSVVEVVVVGEVELFGFWSFILEY